MTRMLGDAFVAIKSDITGFARDLKAKINAELKGVSADVPVTAKTLAFDASMARLRTQIAALKQSMSDLSLDASDKALTAKIAAATAKVASLEQKSSSLQLDFEDKAAIAKILALRVQAVSLEKQLEEMPMGIRADAAEAKLAEVNAHVAVLRDNLRNTLAADMKTGAIDAEIAAVRAEIARLQEEATIVPELKSKEIDAQIAALTAKLDEMTRDRTVDVSIGTAGSSSLLNKIFALGGSDKGGGGSGRGGSVLTQAGQTLAPGGATATPTGVAAIAAAAVPTLAILGPIVPSLTAAGLAIASFGALALPTLSDLNTALGTVSTASDKYTAASMNLNTAIHQSPADLAAYKAVLTGLEPDLASAAVLLTNQNVTWQTLTPAQRASEIALRNNAAAYKTLLPAQQNALNALISEGNAWNSLSPAQQKAGTATQKMQDAFTSLTDALAPTVLTLFAGALKVITDLMPHLLPLAQAAAKAFTPLLNQLDRFAQSSGFQTFVDQMVQLAGPAIVALGQGLGKVAGSLGNLLLAMASPNGARILLGIFTLLAAAINGLALGFRIVEPAVTAVINFIAAHWATIGPLLEVPFKNAFLAIKGGFDFFMGIVRLFAALFTGNWSGMWNDAKQTAARIWSDISKAAENLWKALVPRTIRHEIAVIFDGIRGDLGRMWNNTYNETIGAVTRIGHNVETQFNSLRHATADIFDGMRADVHNIWNLVYNDTIGVAIRIGHNVETQFDSLRHAIANIFNGARADLHNIWNLVYNDTIGAAIRIYQGLTSNFQRALTWFHNVFGTDVSNFFTKTVPGYFRTAVTDIGNVWSGIQNALAGPVNWVVLHALNPLIRAWDFVVNHIGLGTLNIPTVPGFGGGGAVPPNNGLKALAGGGRLLGFGGGDIIPALLEPGEAVVDKTRTRKFASVLGAMGVPGFAGGGVPGRGSSLGAGNPTGGNVLTPIFKGLLSGTSDIFGIFAALASSNATALGNDITKLTGIARGGGSAAGAMASLVAGVTGKLVGDVAQRLISVFAGSPASTAGTPVKFSGVAGVTQWEPDVLRVLAMLGLPSTDLPTVMAQILTESGGNPNAINLSDINAQQGDPSRGLLQTIATTFAAYRNPALSGNIYDPLANIYAGLNYAIHRYGNPGWLSVLGHGHGYDAGGWLPPGRSIAVNNTGQYERVTPGGGEKLSAGEAAIIARLDALIQVSGQQGYRFAGALNSVAVSAGQRGSYSARR